MTNKLDLNANFDPKMDMTKIPQCWNRWCKSNLPANQFDAFRLSLQMFKLKDREEDEPVLAATVEN